MHFLKSPRPPTAIIALQIPALRGVITLLKITGGLAGRALLVVDQIAESDLYDDE
jgi:hypothetical protein